jgi:transposase InsO family protein
MAKSLRSTKTVDHRSMCSRTIAAPARHFSFTLFDVLTLAGRSLQDRPLAERRKVLRTKILPRMPESVLFSETLEATGYRRITHQLRAEGMVVNHKAVARLMRGSGLQVRPLRKFVRTTDSDHDGPIFPNLAGGLHPTGPNQLWVADLTYIRIVAGFVYLAVILDAWSRDWLCARSADRYAACAGRAAKRDRDPTATARLHPPL